MEKEPEVVEASPIETTVTLPVTNSFYDDVIRDQKFDPESAKRMSLEFEDDLARQVSSLHETARLYTAPPSITNRGPLPKPKEGEE
jgi:hypothetical protein